MKRKTPTTQTRNAAAAQASRVTPSHGRNRMAAFAMTLLVSASGAYGFATNDYTMLSGVITALTGAVVLLVGGSQK
jgi:hypothetical protein